MTNIHDLVIADQPPPEFYAAGLEIDCQCARCGSSMDFHRCEEWNCDDGVVDSDDDDYELARRPCGTCRGRGGWHRCLSSPEWCEANPLPGREQVRRGKIEWFCVKEWE